MPIARRCLLVALALLTIFVSHLPAQQNVTEPPTLRDRLVAGLQVRRPSEFDFIDAVIDTVERGELPQLLVDRFFFWARGKAARSRTVRRGILYFQPGLETQAEQLKIEIRPDQPASATS